MVVRRRQAVHDVGAAGDAALRTMVVRVPQSRQ